MPGDGPDFVYRGTTQSRIDEGFGGNSSFPPNWTGSPIQAVSYAAGYVLGDSHNHVPVVMVAEYDTDLFTVGGPGVPSLMDFEVEGSFEPSWYEFRDISHFDTEQARDNALEMFDLDNLDAFIEQHLDGHPEQHLELTREYFERYTDRASYQEMR